MNASSGRCGNSTYGRGARRALWTGLSRAPRMRTDTHCLKLPGTLMMLLHIPDCSCSPHSCEVVKTRFFTLFWSREPQKGAVQGRLARFSAERGGPRKAGTPAAQDLCERLSVGDFGRCRCMALAVLRGPIRRRPYNRGQIITMSRAEMAFITGFSCAPVRRRGRAAADCHDGAAPPGRWRAANG